MDAPLTGEELKPRSLKKGDLIEIVSPASPIEVSQVDDVTKLFFNEGYRVRLSKHALDRDWYLAGADRDRADDLQQAFADPDVSAVYCSRGGYGCARLFPYLDLNAIASSGKLFLGYSDITTLHIALNRRGMPTVYAPMALTLSRQRNPWVIESFTRILKGNPEVPAEAPHGETIVPGRADGIVTGGCLILMADSIGTDEPIDARDKIVLIEDVDEAPHRVDAMLTHLLNAHVLDDAAGIVVGEMTRTNEKADASIGEKPWDNIVIERLKPLGKPMVINYPFGHMPNMLSLLLGIRAVLDSQEGTLTYTETLCVER